jgi:cytochrome P450
LSYKPVLSNVGTGLVTADGALWQKQRLLMAPALRVDMLDAIVPIAKAAVDRLAAQLEQHRGSGEPGDWGAGWGGCCCAAISTLKACQPAGAC